MVEAKVRFKFPTTLINKVNFDHSELDTQKIISWNWFHGKTLMSNSKVKRWLLNSDIFLWYSNVFLEMLLVKFWHFQKYVRNLFKKMSQLKSQHLTWSGPLNLEMTKLLVDFVKVYSKFVKLISRKNYLIRLIFLKWIGHLWLYFLLHFALFWQFVMGAIGVRKMKDYFLFKEQVK